MNEQFPVSEFDEWAASYDQNVETEQGFPFEGYSRMVETIFDQSGASPGAAVLDLGTGTGNLALRFARYGCRVWGLDFSGEMLVQARRKLPGVPFAQADIRGPWPPEFYQRYNSIVSAYTFHHFPLPEKVELCRRLLTDHLSPGGSLVIGDIAFLDAAEEQAYASSLGDEWDQEYYWLADETIDAFALAGMEAQFTKVSSCGGVFQVS